MCLLRIIIYGEFSEFVREKKITYNVVSTYNIYVGTYLIKLQVFDCIVNSLGIVMDCF